MHPFLHDALLAGAASLGGVLVTAALLTLSPRVSPAFSEWLRKAPGLDLAIVLLTIAPWAVASVFLGWAGAVGALGGQVAALYAWVWAHEAMHRDAVRGPRIVRELNRIVGRFRNHAALWLSALAVPVFWMIRLAEVLVYPPLARLVRFPQIDQAAWVNVSRHKFEGLVGHDLLWCLYCDWMTGVYSLGAEMLRHVESFWCPIRFSDASKCENCRLDFPDIEAGWVRHDATMAEVRDKVAEMYGGGDHRWFGARVALTISTGSKTTADAEAPAAEQV